MIHTMDQAGVKLLTFSHHLALFSPDFGNRPSIEAVRRYPDRLRAYCVINPNYPEIAERDISAFEDFRDVFVGFNSLRLPQIALTDERYRLAWEYLKRTTCRFWMHTWGGSPYDGPRPSARWRQNSAR